MSKCTILGYCHKHKSWPKRSHAWLHTHTLSHQLTVARSHRTFLLTQQGPARCSNRRDIHTNARTNTWTHTGAPACLTYRAEFLTTRTLCTLPSSLSLSFTHTHTHARTHAHAHTQWGEVDYGLCGLFWNFQRLVARQQEELLYPVVIRWGERIERWRGENTLNVILTTPWSYWYSVTFTSF